MRNLAENLKNKIYYSLASIKNRYPCKIVKIKNSGIHEKHTQIAYQIVNKLNLREIELQELVNDPLLVEKFHPTECIKIGFLCATDILNQNSSNLEEVKLKFEEILGRLFNN